MNPLVGLSTLVATARGANIDKPSVVANLTPFSTAGLFSLAAIGRYVRLWSIVSRFCATFFLALGGYVVRYRPKSLSSFAGQLPLYFAGFVAWILCYLERHVCVIRRR